MSKVIRIAIDGNEANVAKRVGSNAYAYELLKAIEVQSRNNDLIQCTVLLTTAPVADLPPARTGWSYHVFGPPQLWTQFALPLFLFKHRKQYDVFFTPGHYAPRVSAVPYVSSVMDLAFLQYPEQFRQKDLLQLTEWTRYSVRHAKRVIAISAFTKKDIVRAYHIPADRIVVAYPGFSLKQKIHLKDTSREHILRHFHITGPFILYVGTIQPRKNLPRLIQAFELLHTNHPHLQLVIAGKVGWLATDTMAAIETSPLKSSILVLGYVDEDQKAALYLSAAATVLVGLHEGFGIPALEAMAYQCIPVVSQTTSLPEVVGGAGIYVNPLDAVDIAQGIRQVLNASVKRKTQLHRHAREQIKQFSWENAASIVMHTLTEVATTH